jgi:hypothetical protein
VYRTGGQPASQKDRLRDGRNLRRSDCRARVAAPSAIKLIACLANRERREPPNQAGADLALRRPTTKPTDNAMATRQINSSVGISASMSADGRARVTARTHLGARYVFSTSFGGQSLVDLSLPQ